VRLILLLGNVNCDKKRIKTSLKKCLIYKQNQQNHIKFKYIAYGQTKEISN